MENGKDSSGVWDVKRTIHLDGEISGATAADVVVHLHALDGVHRAVFAGKNGQLTISYSAAIIDYATILTVLEECGISLAPSWWQRLKGRWYQFTDSNARENANLPPPACCNKPPKKP